MVPNFVLTGINRNNEVGSFAKFSGVMASSLPVLMLSFISSIMLSQICRNFLGSARPTQEIRYFKFTKTDTKYISASPKRKVVQQYGFYLFKNIKEQ
jgi:broad specificity polyphosphatase/5'/3'-nucleotidase SurE